MVVPSRAKVVAVLGPTNTGKTYLAFERMLGHGSGMMGFPLRLLARENYDRAVKLKGERQVALITGEEKIVPPYAKWFFCTVESMPVEKRVAFLAVDEIQLCADPDRGHVFTERLLYARGLEETMFMGADTIRPLLKRLLPEAEIVSRPRFSTLSYAGAKKIQRLPPRSAIVGFTAEDVYTIAELVRRTRGGAAIVMGALSPRTRNAQVALFQSGEVDYLVATDAIGMGLNMDVDHVAFADIAKFDGKMHRELRPEELAQIAGRAGRHMSDGTFGVTGEAPELSPAVVQRIQAHDFEPLRALMWRSPALDFASPAALKASLAREPSEFGLKRVQPAADERVLDELLRDPDVAPRVGAHGAVQRLWQVCQIPDFGRSAGDRHSRLLAQIFRLLEERGRLPEDWFAAQVAGLDNFDGGIDHLLRRIAHIRIWTFVAHRADWIDNHAHWQERTRDIENRLSDALHRALIQRFVDARTTTLLRRLQDKERLVAAVTVDGAVTVEGHPVGRLEGFKFHPDAVQGELAGRAVSNAAFRALGGELARRAGDLVAAPHDDLKLTDDGTLTWHHAPIARLLAGPTPLRPNLGLIGGELLDAAVRNKVEERLAKWLTEEITATLAPLVRASAADIAGHARGVVYQLTEALGAVSREQLQPLVQRLQKQDFSTLRRHGIWVGQKDVYFPALVRPKPARLAALLWAISNGLAPIPPLPPATRTSLPLDEGLPPAFLRAAGYARAGTRLVRLDIVERLFDMARVRAAEGPFAADASLHNLLGCSPADTEEVLKALGFRVDAGEEGTRFRKPRPQPRRRERNANVRADSPFAKLQDLKRR
jgi:ATP-dependent RNA helicase SUPV3L1/SUV3